MQWWYYRGQVTTPIDIPGKGPTVLRPRDKFQAPFASVAHLRRLKRVVQCKPPKELDEERAVALPVVIASKAEPKAEVVETEKIVAAVEEESTSKPKAMEMQEKEATEEKEKEKEKETRSRRKKS